MKSIRRILVLGGILGVCALVLGTSPAQAQAVRRSEVLVLTGATEVVTSAPVVTARETVVVTPTQVVVQPRRWFRARPVVVQTVPVVETQVIQVAPVVETTRVLRVAPTIVEERLVLPLD